jgi:hypothetical protein
MSAAESCAPTTAILPGPPSALSSPGVSAFPAIPPHARSAGRHAANHLPAILVAALRNGFLPESRLLFALDSSDGKLCGLAKHCGMFRARMLFRF